MKRLKIRIIIETLFFASAFSLFFLWQHKNFVAFGVLIGAFTGIICFHLLAGHILKSTSIGLQKIKPYFFLKYLIRYAIMGVVLFLCAKINRSFFIGAACGLLLIYLAVFLDSFILNKQCKVRLK